MHNGYESVSSPVPTDVQSPAQEKRRANFLFELSSSRLKSSSTKSQSKNLLSWITSANQNKTADAARPNAQSSGQSDKLQKQDEPAAQDYFLVEEETLRSVIIATEPVGVTIDDADANKEHVILPSNLEERGSISVSEFLDPLLLQGIEFTSNDAPGVIKAQTSFKKSLYLFGETGVGMIFASKPDYTSGWSSEQEQVLD